LSIEKDYFLHFQKDCENFASFLEMKNFYTSVKTILYIFFEIITIFSQRKFKILRFLMK